MAACPLQGRVLCCRLVHTAYSCVPRLRQTQASHDNAEYGIVNGIHRTPGIIVGETDPMWFDRDGAYQGNVDLSVSVPERPFQDYNRLPT